MVIATVLWDWKIDGVINDNFNILGGFIALIGMGIMIYAPTA